MNFPKNASKQQKGLVYQYVAHFVEKFFFVLIFIPFYWFDQKHLFKEIQIFLRILYLFKHGKKTKLSEYFIAVSERATFLTKKRVLCEFPQKCFKTTERHI